MKIKIARATLPTYWYASCIGEVYDVYGWKDGCDGGKYDVGYNRLVDQRDCHIVTETLKERWIAALHDPWYWLCWMFFVVTVVLAVLLLR